MAGPTLTELHLEQRHHHARISTLERAWREFKPDVVADRLTTLHTEVTWIRRFLIGGTLTIIAILVGVILAVVF